jgi:glycerophosphoryl diester phosphodiesterase
MSGRNPWLDRRVLSYAHQGGAREAPSSTLFAFRAALAAGADALEMDVHATRDGELVVCHDSTVDRTTNGSGRIADLTLAEVRALDPAYWFVPGEVAVPGRDEHEYLLRGRAPEDPELRIPTLREVLEAFPGVFLNLDIKQTAPLVQPYEAALARLLREFGRRDDVIVASFNDLATAEFSRHAPEVTTSAGTAASASFWQAFRAGEPIPSSPHSALQVPTTFGSTRIATPEVIAAAHRAGLAVHFWTIDDPVEMAELVELGADGIMSDRPSVLVGVIADRGLTYLSPES